MPNQVAEQCCYSLRLVQKINNPAFLWQAGFATKMADFSEFEPVMLQGEIFQPPDCIQLRVILLKSEEDARASLEE